MDEKTMKDAVVKRAVGTAEDAAKLTQEGTKSTGNIPEAATAVQNIQPVESDVNDQNNSPTLKDGNGNVTNSFSRLPIESLIRAPIVAVAKGQQELTKIYIDNVLKLAYKDGKAPDQETPGKEVSGETNTLTLSGKRPAYNGDGTVTEEEVEIHAPLLSLVPVPTFTMDEVAVDFDMEVKSSNMDSSETKSDVDSTVNYESWFGLNANITGSVTSDSRHKRETDPTATYKIHEHAIQQPPSEGMAKLTSLFAQEETDSTSGSK